MADARFEVYPGGREEARRAMSGDVRAIAEDIMRSLVQATPVSRTARDSGQLRGAWRLEPGRDPATWLVVNPDEAFMFVEFGTSRMPARPFVGPVLAAYRARLGGRG